MRSLLCCLFGMFLVAAAMSGNARAQEDGRAALRQSIEALQRAPGYRVTVTDTGSSATQLRMDVVNPGLLHLRTGMGTEVYSDGRTILSREGVSGPFTEARGNVAATVALARQLATPDALLQMATGVRFAGRDSVGGVPASIYAVDALVLGMRVNARVWVADADRRPLRTEAEVDGELRMGGRAAGRRVHRSSVITYEYDPSIQVAMPRG